MLSQLQVRQWVKLGTHFGLTKDQIENFRSHGNPTAETFITAKKKNIDMNFRDVLEGLLAIGEYELAERVCTEQGWSCMVMYYIPETPEVLWLPLGTTDGICKGFCCM